MLKFIVLLVCSHVCMVYSDIMAAKHEPIVKSIEANDKEKSKSGTKLGIFSWNAAHQNIAESWKKMEQDSMLPQELVSSQLDILVVCIQEDGRSPTNPSNIGSLETNKKLQYQQATLAGGKLGSTSAYIYIQKKDLDAKRFTKDFAWKPSSTTNLGKGYINIAINDVLNPEIGTINVACAHLDAHAEAAARGESIGQFFQDKQSFAVMAGDYNYRLQMDTKSSEYNDVLTSGIDYMNAKVKSIFDKYGLKCNDISNWYHTYKLATDSRKTAKPDTFDKIKEAVKVDKNKNIDQLLDRTKVEKAPFEYDKEITKVKEIKGSNTKFALNYGYLDRACYSNVGDQVKVKDLKSYQILSQTEGQKNDG